MPSFNPRTTLSRTLGAVAQSLSEGGFQYRQFYNRRFPELMAQLHKESYAYGDFNRDIARVKLPPADPVPKGAAADVKHQILMDNDARVSPHVERLMTSRLPYYDAMLALKHGGGLLTGAGLVLGTGSHLLARAHRQPAPQAKPNPASAS